MADLNKIVDDLSALSVIEAAELSKLLEEKWGVSAAAPVAAAAAAPAAGEAAPAEEKRCTRHGKLASVAHRESGISRKRCTRQEK